jgi:hypothetical protein
MARKRAKKKKKEDVKVVEAIIIDESLTSATIPMLPITLNEVLKGSNAAAIQEVLKVSGFSVGRDKCYRLIKLAKAEIMKRAEKSIAENYAWAEANLMKLHAEAVDDKDKRAQVVIIKELIDLWGIKRQEIKETETEITPEMIEQFEQALLR